MIRPTVILPAILFFLSACGQNPPVPVDHFYKLNIESTAVNSMQLTNGVIYVEGFRAEGIYNERALLYSDDENSRELQQYHYHFWAMPPAAMLREHLVEYLRRAGAAPVVINETGNRDGVVINGRLLGFEKRIAGDDVSVSVVIELRMDVPGHDFPRLIRRYEEVRNVDNESVAAAVTAFNEAVDGIYAEFLADAAESK